MAALRRLANVISESRSKKRAGPRMGPACIPSGGAGWPSPLRGSVGLGATIPMLRIGAPRLEPASLQLQNLLIAK